MPRARRGQPSEAPAEEEEEMEDVMEDVEGETTQPLVFQEAITWKPGKQIPVSDLLRRLKALADELAQIDQSEADRDTLVPKAQDLANTQLLSHRDKGVKAWTMLCLVHMFRLLAPDAPYKATQLKQIFDIFISTIVPALASPSDPYFAQYFQVLTSLTTIKSIVLLADIPGAEPLILTLFTNCFDVLAGNVKGGDVEQLPKNIEYHMTNMLCILVDECGSNLSSDVVDVILAQFLRVDPNTLAPSKKGDTSNPGLREVSPAFNMARAICNTCGETMDRAVANYFTSVLVDASESGAMNKPKKAKGKKRTHDESEDESDDGLDVSIVETDLQEVEKAHRLLRELWRSSPDVVRSVIPSMETEVTAELVPLRTMAVQTVGDMVAGIGAAGPPPPPTLNPAAYPSQSLEEGSSSSEHLNVALAPHAPHAFAAVHPGPYQSFVDRNRDRSANVRAAWATAAGRILMTSGGGKGLDNDHENDLLKFFSNMLVDQDEKVRLAAVQAIADFNFNAVLQKLGKHGSVSMEGSILYNLADRVKDKKQNVRVPATEILARIWGVASGAIAEGSDHARELLGAIPSKILAAIYSNDPDINASVQKVLYESLLPISYPPIKPKNSNVNDSQRIASSQAEAEPDLDPDYLRAERALVLFRDLDERGQKVLFSLLGNQANKAKYVEGLIQLAIDLKGGDPEDMEKGAKQRFDAFIDGLSRREPDPTLAANHLRQFAKSNDRRNFQLIRFCYSPESDYRKVFKAIKELTKRIGEGPSASVGVLDTLIPLVHSVSILVFNRSHVPAIMEIARTDGKGLGTAAHELLKEIAAKAPQVFKVHVHELCEALKKQAPSANNANDISAVDTLKACSGFARRFPDEMPKDRAFCQAMVAFAMYGSPPKAAKHAVTVLVASADKKEMYIKQLLKYCLKDFNLDSEHALAKLATLSQLKLVASKETEDMDDDIMTIAAERVLKLPTPTGDSDAEWPTEIDDHLNAKLWALRILVNGLRGLDTSGDVQDVMDRIKPVADQVYKLLNTLIDRDGELSKSNKTPAHYKARLRLAAAIQLLKLSCNPIFDRLLTQRDFNRLAKIAQDPLPEVRGAFVQTLKKYIGQNKLQSRFYGYVFLYAYEPNKATKEATMTWLKSRASLSARRKDTTMESVFARFLSLLAHHQDFSMEPEDLVESVEYILFYLKCVATEENTPLIYHIAQRLKSVQDGIDSSMSENLYVISDLADATIRHFQELQGWSIQLYSTKVRLPTNIFAPLSNHDQAQEIADKIYAPEEVLEHVEDLVKKSLRSKKRKSEATSNQAAKKVKQSTQSEPKKTPARKPAKAPKASKKRPATDVPSSERRKSARRSSNTKNYAEEDSDDEDEEMEQWQEGDEEEDNDQQSESGAEDVDNEGNKENVSTSTPPTSDPPVPRGGRSVTKTRKESASSSKTTTRKTSQALPARTRSTRRSKKDDSDDEMSDAEA